MATAPVDSTSSVAGSATSSLKLNDLLKVLLTELTHQDPLKPVDNTQFLSQIAQFASLDASQQLNQNIEQLVSLQAINQSVGLIGRTVTATTSTGTVTGVVGTLSLSGSTPTFSIKTADGQVVPNVTIGQIQTILPKP
jgi:flagellar basal-body rod modification protein FlgD